MPKFARPNSYNGKQSNKNWTGQVRAANEVEAAAGISEQLYISPATLASAVGDLVPSATTTTEGVVLLTDNHSPVATKFYADNLAIAGAPAWSETISGIGQLATTAEAQAGLIDDVAITPLKLAQALVGGLPITGGAGSFTTLAASGLSSLSGSATILTAGTALNLASDADTAAINIGTGAGARTIIMGNSTGATSIALNVGTGALNLGTNAVAHTVTIGNITGATAVNLNAGSGGSTITTTNSTLALVSGTGAINIGADAAAKTITMGNSTGATSLVFNCGTGALNIGTNAVAHTITLGNSTGATSLVLDAGTGAINIGTNAIAHTVTIGNITGATGMVLQVGTGNFTLDGVAGSTYAIGASTTTGTFSIGGTGANTGTMTIAGGTGAQTINIANSTGGKTIAIGTGAGANAVTIGSTNTTSSTTINAGSGNINATGGNLKIATTGKGLQIKAGAATDMAGTAVLVLGTVTVSNTNIATGDLIFLSRVAANGSVTLGELSYTISNGASFTITSLIVGTPASPQTADVSTIAYFIVRPV